MGDRSLPRSHLRSEAADAAGEGACAGERRSPGSRCSSAQDLVLLNGILQYGCELNRSQGVGFTVLSRRMCVCVRLSRCCEVVRRPSFVVLILTEALPLLLVDHPNRILTSVALPVTARRIW